MLEEVTTPGRTQQGTVTSFNEVCPNCGEYTDILQEDTGWCIGCSPQVCVICNSEFQAKGLKRTCSEKCKSKLWIATNADALEKFTSQGFTFSEAKQKVFDERRPICNCCYNPISGGTVGVHLFCTKSPACRTAQRRYRTLRSRYPAEVALQLVTQELLREGNNEADC